MLAKGAILATSSSAEAQAARLQWPRVAIKLVDSEVTKRGVFIRWRMEAADDRDLCLRGRSCPEPGADMAQRDPAVDACADQVQGRAEGGAE